MIGPERNVPVLRLQIEQVLRHFEGEGGSRSASALIRTQSVPNRSCEESLGRTIRVCPSPIASAWLSTSDESCR